tara:strand:- start:978 stop:1208 length:231 start_codon:yes stop_codon:yes gene_type:complete
MPTEKKNEAVRVTVSVKADQRLSAALRTEVTTEMTPDGFLFSIDADSISDARARTNTVLRSLVAAHNAGIAIGAWE